MIDISTLDILLMEYAAGHLRPYEGLMVAVMLAIKPEERKKVRELEALSGKAMSQTMPAPLSAGCFDAVMKKIETAKSSQDAKKQVARIVGVDLSPAVTEILSRSCCADTGCWKPMARGIDCVDLKICESEPAGRKLRLMRLAPHQKTPSHSHDGQEMMLVLEGGFTDQSGHYGPGDFVIINDPHYIHAPVAGENGCLCLTLTNGPLRFRQRALAIMNFFWRV